MKKTKKPIAEPARLLTADDLADMLRVCSRHIWRMADAGQLPSPLRIGRSVRWDRRAIEKWLDAMQSEGDK